MKQWAWLAVLVLGLLLGTGLQAEPIRGKVIDVSTQQGLAKVSIKALASGSSWIVPGGTNDDGSFSFELAEGFSGEELNTVILNLEFEKAGYRKATRMQRSQIRGVFHAAELLIRLEALDDNGPVHDESSTPPATSAAKRIFHGAYAIYGDAAEDDDSLTELNQRLPRHLRRGIITHLQRLQLPANIDLDPVPGTVEQADSLQLRSFAQSQDALAVILGEAELVLSEGDEVIELASEFRIIPLLPEFQPGALYVDDQIPKDQLRPSRLSRSLSKTWGGSTVLALALYETRAALRQSDLEKKAAGLARAESFLKAQRRSLPRHDILKQQIDDLLALIERKRTP